MSAQEAEKGKKTRASEDGKLHVQRSRSGESPSDSRRESVGGSTSGTDEDPEDVEHSEASHGPVSPLVRGNDKGSDETSCRRSREEEWIVSESERVCKRAEAGMRRRNGLIIMTRSKKTQVMMSERGRPVTRRSSRRRQGVVTTQSICECERQELADYSLHADRAR
jgi:hypothetical protein